MKEKITRQRTCARTKGFRLEHWHIVGIGLAVYDAIAVNAAFLLALWARYDCQFSAIPERYMQAFLSFSPWYTAACLVTFWLCRLYKSIWRFASLNELLYVVLASVITGVIHILGITFGYRIMPYSYYITGIILQFLAVLGIRFSYRLVILLREARAKGGTRHNVMLIGAGAAGQC